MTAIANGAADLAPPRSNTGTIPDHSILGSLVCFSNSIGPLVDFIVASFFFVWFAFTFNPSNSMACAHQCAAQVWPFPLVINAIRETIV